MLFSVFYNICQRVERTGQRLITLFAYLNDIPKNQGGGTVFPELNVTFHPKKNTALLWFNQDARGNMDERTLHGGEAIQGDFEKWGLK